MTAPKDDSKIENLIDLSPLEDTPVEENNCFLTVENKNSENVVESEKSDKQEAPYLNEPRNYSRLCGYLNKLGNRAILKTFRKRWFVFNENNCKLYYYRSPQEQVPLGEIDISQATFTFDIHNREKEGLFTISIPGRDYYLEASSRQACLFWLQELQKYRRINSVLRTKGITEKSSSVDNIAGRPQSGLLAHLPEFDADIYNTKGNVPLMSPIDCPTDVIGDDSACDANNPFINAQQKLHVIYNQLRTSKSFSKYDKSSGSSNANQNSKSVNPSNQDSSESIVYRSNSGSQSKSGNSNKSFSALKMKLSFRKSQQSDDKSVDSDLQPSGKEHCSRCSKLDLQIESLSDEISNLKEDVTASQEVISLFRRQLDIASKEKDTLVQIYQLKDSKENLDLLNMRDQQIVTLTHDLQEHQQNIEELQRQIISLNSEIEDLRKNNELFQEMLLRKDKTIMTLTNEVFELETERQDENIKKVDEKKVGDESNGTNVVIEHKDAMSLDELQDAVQAFELQNKFLNNEILELNQLRRDSEERVSLLTVKCSEWEARTCQIQSKLLYILNEMQRSGGNSFSQDIVSQLLEEATGDGTTHTSLLPSWSRERMYDDLGFNWRWGKDDLISLKASNLKQRSEDITNKANDAELVSWRSKWDNFMVALGSKELLRSQELKALVRTGVPHEYRGRIWKGCSLMWIKHHKASFGPNYYNSLLLSEVYNTRLDPYAKQIELDLLRTLPNNMHYESVDSDGIPKLRRVLLAFSRHSPEIGYCQGLNRLAAIALLFMEEEDAFWCLVAITRKIMPENYYSQTLIGSHVDQKVLKDLMAEKLPRLNAHLEQNNVELSLFTFNWFFTVFVDNIPVETYLRIWDVFLYEGSKVLFRYALAILKLYENEILQMKDYLSINKSLRCIFEKVIDPKKLTNIAFNDLNPFSIKTIASKRVQHYPIIQAQMQELVTMRNSLSRKVDKTTPADYLSEED